MSQWSKPVLVEALRAMPRLCPPRLVRQDKAELARIVRLALSRSEGDPVRGAMLAALAEAERYVQGKKN